MYAILNKRHESALNTESDDDVDLARVHPRDGGELLAWKRDEALMTKCAACGVKFTSGMGNAFVHRVFECRNFSLFEEKGYSAEYMEALEREAADFSRRSKTKSP